MVRVVWACGMMIAGVASGQSTAGGAGPTRIDGPTVVQDTPARAKPTSPRPPTSAKASAKAPPKKTPAVTPGKAAAVQPTRVPTPRQAPKPVAASTDQGTPRAIAVGDIAPALSIEEWTKGPRIDTLEPGKVYLVEFWATWCAPCIGQMSSLSETQRRYRDQGLVVIGVASEEPGTTRQAKLESVRKLVRERGRDIDYTIGVDVDGSMVKTWKEAAGRSGLPIAFLVDHRGRIAFIGAGAPMAGMDEAVKRAVAAARGARAEGQAQVLPAAFEQPLVEEAKPSRENARERSAPKDAEKGAKLELGSPAPALEVGRWLKGEPVTRFEPGKVYVIDLWATWVGKIKDNIARLSELQAKYPKVTFLGVNVLEQNTADVDPFVASMGSRLTYPLALDRVPDPKGSGRSAVLEAARQGRVVQAWLRPAERTTLPTTFIVDERGRIAWFGAPGAGFEQALEQIVAGTWDLDARAAAARKERELESTLRPLRREVEDAALAGDWERVVLALNRIIDADPTNPKPMIDKFAVLFKELRDYDKAYALGELLVEGPLKEDGAMLNDIAWMIVDPDADVGRKDLKLAMRAASRAAELTKHEDPAVLDTLARVYFEQGELAKAHETQAKAVELARGQIIEEELKDRLEEYADAKKAQGDKPEKK